MGTSDMQGMIGGEAGDISHHRRGDNEDNNRMARIEKENIDLEMQVELLEKENSELRHRHSSPIREPLSPNATADRMRRENNDLRSQLASTQQILKDLQNVIAQLPSELRKQLNVEQGWPLKNRGNGKVLHPL